MGSANVGLSKSSTLDVVDMLTNGPVSGWIINGPVSGPESARAIPASPSITIIVVQVIIANFFIVFSPKNYFQIIMSLLPTASSRKHNCFTGFKTPRFAFVVSATTTLVPSVILATQRLLITWLSFARQAESGEIKIRTYVMSFHLSSPSLSSLSLSSFPARHQRQISAAQAQRKRTS